MVPHPSKKRRLDSIDSAEHVLGSEELNSLDNGGAHSGSSKDEELANPTPQQLKAQKRSKPQRNGTIDSKASEAFIGETNRSTMFKLQVDELLSEIRPNYQRKKESLDGVLQRLKTVIEQLPEREAKGIQEAERDAYKSDKITIPFPDPKPPKDANYKVAYSKPTSINVVGSFALKTASKENGIITVDLAVVMPSTIFQDKDYLNYRYFHKRAYYLACLAAGLKVDEKSAYDISFASLSGNPLLPIIQLKAKGSGKGGILGSKCHIQVIPVLGEETFKMSKTLPSSCCVRKAPLDNGEATEPTPFYNASVRSDALVVSYLKTLHAASIQCSSFQDACLLGRIWLRQRGFGSNLSKGGCGHFEWAAMVAMLLQGGGYQGKSVLSSGYSSYQLFKATLNFLATRDLESSPLLFQSHDTKIPKSGGPYFVDGTKGINVLFKMSSWAYRKLRYEAKLTVEMLNDSVLDHFEPTFIMSTDTLLQKFDNYVRIPVSVLKSVPDKDFQTSYPLILQSCQDIYSILSRGLGDRVNLIDFSWPEGRSWSTKVPSPSPGADEDLVIGFILDPTNFNRSIDHGPAAEEKEAAGEFRRFWGEKAELRRFKDGRILESLIWSEKDTSMSIFQQIVRYILDRHFRRDLSEAATFVGELFDDLIPTGPMTARSGIAPFRPLMDTFDQLEKSIRAAEDLPLQLRQISAASSQLSYSSLQTPNFNPAPNSAVDPANVVISFEGSGRWPDDLSAIQRTKIAILLKMGELLEDTTEGIVTRPGLENEESDITNSTFLDLIYPNGGAFRLRIQADHEQILLERLLKQRDLSAHTREEAVLALASYKRGFISSPTHTQAFRTLCTRFPLLSPSIRLVKKWFESHLLSSHVCEELVELFVARVFVQPHPYQPPSSVMTGFLRTIHMLSRWDWRTDPLIVDLGGDMTSQNVDTIKIRFEAWRKVDPAMNRVVLFVGSNIDSDGVTWTQHARPSKVVATRMTTLARSACALVKEQGLELDPKELFASSTDDYDFVVHLHPRFSGANRGKTPSKRANQYKNLQVQVANKDDIDLVGYDPVGLFIDELKSLYGGNIIFFHQRTSLAGGSGPGGSVICGLWNPQSTAPRPWKVNLTYSTRPVLGHMGGVNGTEKQEDAESSGEESHLDFNKPAVLNEIARLGGDMISRIELH
ncbi:MAG: hypothetical protein M4579_005472 [Chaenotheca gracillima]|nr:MAG: hypothetical protein M4579_005472 [Chaenotheca gracillima]